MTQLTTILYQRALEYQRLLGAVTIPLHQGKPLIQWRELVDRFPSEDEQQQWPWDKADGLALLMGQQAPQGGYWWCLDIEQPHRPAAEAWLDDEFPGWRKGLVAESQSGGLHVYCLSQKPVPNGKCLWGDVKGRGGMVFAPPTRRFKPHAQSDYRWLSFQPDEALSLEPSELPESAAQTNGHTVREALAQTIPVGQRNLLLTSLAGFLRGKLRCSQDAILAILRTANHTSCEEPLPESELQAIARSAGKWPTNPILVVGNGSEPVDTNAPQAVDIATLPEPRPREWLVPDLVPAHTITTWYGDDGTGKSILALALALCVASGQAYLGRPVLKGPVLYVDTEFDQDEFVRRAYRLARGYGWSRPPSGLIYFRARYSLTTPGGQQDLRHLVEVHQPRLVIVDSLTLGAYTDDLKEASAVVLLMEFLQQLPTTVLTLDHIPKPIPGATLAYARPWGSFAKRAKARHAVLVTPAEASGLVMRVTKSNVTRAGAMVGVEIVWGEAIRVRAISLQDDALAGVEVHLPLLEQIHMILARNEAMTPEELAEETGLAIGTVKNKLTVLRKQGRATPLGDGRWQALRRA